MITHAQRPGLASAAAPVRWFAALRRLLGRAGLLVTLFCLLFPIYWLVQSSLSTQLELFHTPAYFFPPHPTLAGCAGRGMSSAPTCGIRSSSRSGPSS